VEIDFGGWAADPAGPGTGVDAVEVILDGLRGAGGTMIGMARYGNSRPDVAQAYGNMDFTNTGYDLIWRVAGTGGRHTAHVYAHSIANGWRYRSVNFNISGPAAAPARTTTQPYGPQMGGMYGGQQYGQGYGQQYGQGYGQPYDPFNPTGTAYGRGYGGYLPPPPPPPPYGGYGGYGYGGGIGYSTTTTVVAPTGGSILLNWIAVPNAQSYRIYQAPASAPSNLTVIQTITQVAGQLTTNATISGLAPGQLYYLQVRAVDATGLETTIPSSALGGGGGYYPGYIPPIATTLPAVSGLAVGVRTSNSIALSWTNITTGGPFGVGAASFRVNQSLTAGGPFTTVQTIQQPGLAIATVGTTVTGLAANTPFHYQIVAVDAFGVASPPSATLSTSTLP
jgi:hypothetical protein